MIRWRESNAITATEDSTARRTEAEGRLREPVGERGEETGEPSTDGCFSPVNFRESSRAAECKTPTPFE